MKSLTLALIAALLPFAAQAQSAAEPVNRVMDVAKARWESTEGPGGDYFDHLDRDFSKSFVAAYNAASKYPAYDEGDSPFDYDVITSSQDGCPLRDVIVSPEGDKGGVSVVAVRFRLWACSSDAESQAKINELKFDVVTEGGKPVIADIHRLQDGRWDTLVGEMEETVRLGQARQ